MAPVFPGAKDEIKTSGSSANVGEVEELIRLLTRKRRRSRNCDEPLVIFMMYSKENDVYVCCLSGVRPGGEAIGTFDRWWDLLREIHLTNSFGSSGATA